ncbi:hypothetical protein NliqN6_6404 [Naganishia liquefaciens]|uniref:Uncharacterized protein n=1 Tax=Naganishia liquefaciens TaxID=104408 RepID=A0A8H3TZL3_9TREE|nr:hypothetical protein NliqN6_6404 [Naganishia liquefaciens]
MLFIRSTAVFRAVSKTPVRAFTVSTTWSMPERSQMSGGDAKKLEQEKQKNLSGQQKSPHPEKAPGWNETLASESEAVIKAEHSEPESIDKLQKETVEHVHKE